MSFAHIKDVEGKTVSEARCWPDDEGSTSIQFDFDDGSVFCFTVNPPKISKQIDVKFYSNKTPKNPGEKDLTNKIVKKADRNRDK